MGKESGKKVILQVEKAGSPAEYEALEGQKDTRLSMQGAPIDVSDKTTNNWGATIAGTVNATVTVSGFPVWGSETYWEILREAFENGDTVNCKLVLNESGDAYVGALSVTGFEVGGANDGATEYNITLQNAGALVWTPGA